MVNEQEKEVLIRTFENAKISYEIMLKRVNVISKEIDLLDKAFVQPMKDTKKFFGITLITGGLPLEMITLKERLEFTISHIDGYLKEFKDTKTTS
jgi:hypothetical protein